MSKAKETAIKAAEAAGKLMIERLGAIGKIDYKGVANLVTDVDKASEAIIIEIIQKQFPDDQVLAEESGASEGKKTERRWLIDPIDGTTNFAHSYPFFCVSIALEERGKLVLGVVLNPVSKELFWAEVGGGAWLNDQPIKVSTIKHLGESLLSTGFHPSVRYPDDPNMRLFQHLTDSSHGVRRDGSAALDLCFVACGRTEGFWERKLAPWDMGAGILIIQEAGGKVSNLSGNDLAIPLMSGNIVVSNSLIHSELINALAEAELLATR